MENQKGYAWVVEENRKDDEYQRRSVAGERLLEEDKIQGCCAHIPYVADIHRYTLMHLCAIAGVHSFTAANLRRNRNQLPPEEFAELCQIVQSTELLYGDALPTEVADKIIDNYIQEWLLS